MEIKETLLLPKTEFPMRGNLGVKEIEIQKRWTELDLYKKRLEQNKNNEKFYFHDGPPYANNNIHAGHALNKILKDFILRYRSMQGYYTEFIPGWDTHGLPIENAVTKKGVNRKTMAPKDFRYECEKFALKQVEIQKEQFKRLGMLADFDNPYITLTHDYEARQVEVFAKLVNKNLIYRGLKPVYWSYSSESALAEAEIEYFDVISKSIYLIFNVIKSKDKDLLDSNLLVWTTTPWTLPANLAISVNPFFEYVLFNYNDKKYVCAKNLLDKLIEKLEFNKENIKVVKTFKGEVLENDLYKHPFLNKKLPIILGEHVSEEDGTGLVHTAPGHGEDDYRVGQKYNLDILSPVDEKGYMTEEAGMFAGLFYEEANDKIIDYLKENNYLVKLDLINHSYPHDWRTSKPVIFRATPQWFFSIKPLEKKLLEEIDKVVWHPEWGKIRLTNMIKDRSDWCISRQRLWGVPIPIFYNEDNSPILDEKVIMHVSELFKEKGSNIWYELSEKELLPKNYTNPKSPNNKFKKETDIMDIWFDSGTSFLVMDENYSDIYLEGSDQYRGWFNSSLINSVAINGKAPYKKVISHGFVLDEKGLKMSKSLGNVVDPNLLCKQYGADVLRLWAASIEYTQDVRLSDELVSQVSDNYRKIRNTIRYMLGNLDDFNYENDYISYSMRGKLNKVVTLKLFEVNKKITQAYENSNFSEVIRTVVPFIINDLSAFYLDFTKDTLYVESKNSHIRRSVQSTIYDILYYLLRLLTPIIPHTTSEAYMHFKQRRFEDVYLENMPKINQIKDDVLVNNFNKFMELRQIVLKELENKRQLGVIGKSLNAIINLEVDSDLYDSITSLGFDLRDILKVSDVNIKISKEIKVEVLVSEEKECVRCWNVRSNLNSDNLCQRCEEVVKKDYSL